MGRGRRERREGRDEKGRKGKNVLPHLKQAVATYDKIVAWNSGAPALGSPWTLPTLPTPLLRHWV